MNTHHNQPYLQNLSTQSLHMLSDTIIIGRHQDCNLVLKSEKGASRKHARITVQNGTAVLMDLGSLNGTLVNGREISRAVQLTDGDIVIFDEQEYRFTSATTNAQSGSNNVTVIANKDEIGRPDRIKPAIRLVEAAPPTSEYTNPDLSSDISSFDETAAWDSLTSDLDQMPSTERSDEVAKQNAGQQDNLALHVRAANDRQQKQDLTQKLPIPQEQDLQAHMSQAQGSQTYGAPTQDESQTRGVQSPQDWEPQGKLSQGWRSHAQEQEQQQEPEAFEWHSVDDEPQANNLPAYEHQPMQQPANRRQPPQAAPRPAQQSRGRNAAPHTDRYEAHDRFPSFPATSRPGGDDRSTRPGLQKYNPYDASPRKKINWTLWLVVIPLIALLALGAMYLAYNAGLSAGNTGGSSGFS